jgi:hypothetical protein
VWTCVGTLRRRFGRLALVLIAVWSTCAPAVAADQVVEAALAGPYDEGVELTPAVGAAHDWLVWPHRRTDGAVQLMARHGGGQPSPLPVAPLSEVRSIDVGRNAAGVPAATYDACRGSECGIYTVDLRSGRERRPRLPRTPRGCRRELPVLDGRLFFVLQRPNARPPAKRCRSGIFELRDGRAIRRQRTDYVRSYDVDRGRIAFTIWRDDVARNSVRRPGSQRAQLIDTDSGALADAPASQHLAWAGNRLWIGRLRWPPGTFVIEATLLRLTPRRSCRWNMRPHIFASAGSDLVGALAFTRGRVFYVARSEVDGSYLLMERTDPRPRFILRRCSALKRP